jgi:NAD(P)H-hydrate repair Nnr-like enzyme with NAD(P)H-hydrate dehydratase domain
MDSTTHDIQQERVTSASRLARRYNSLVVLKGAGSICALPDETWFINPTGNPGLSSAGMGDVLSGMIAALIAQRLTPQQALLLAVYLHGAAADERVAQGIGPIGLTATEIADAARSLVNQWVYRPAKG